MFSRRPRTLRTAGRAGGAAHAAPEPALLPAAGPAALRKLHGRQPALAAPAAAARLQHLRLLPLGRRPGRRDRRSASRAWPCWTGGKRSSATAIAAGPPIRCSSPWRETIRQFDIPAEPFIDLLVAFRQDQRVDALRDDRRSCWNTAAARPIRWAGWCSIWAAATRPSGCGWPIRSARACNWPTSARTWPATGTAAASICRRRPAGGSATTRRCSPGGSATTPSANCWPPRWTRPRAGSAGGLPLAAKMPPGLRLPVALFVARRIGYAGGHPPAELRRVDAAADGFEVRETAIAGPLLVELNVQSCRVCNRMAARLVEDPELRAFAGG